MLPRSSRLNAQFAETFVVTRSDSLLFYAFLQFYSSRKFTLRRNLFFFIVYSKSTSIIYINYIETGRNFEKKKTF